ncbi:hypothetical protein [Winogradskyella wichelsiae]|uniref:hypothetical protein n=1 Tax=Winogradskyella wichelsiae TaxID=2697007 RepID=UPI003EF76D6C
MNYNPNIINKTYTIHNIKLGKVYVYNNFMVTEFKEGADINFKNFDELSLIIEKNYKDEPFGFIANRLNSYSINVNDAKKFNEKFTQLKAYAIITYSELTERIIEIESHFFKFNRKIFSDFESAILWIENTLSK